MLAYVVSGHGFGHATRTVAVLDELFARSKDVEVELFTDAPARLFREVACDRLRITARETDVGLVQKDGVDIDLAATERAVARWLDELEDRARALAATLRGRGVRLVAVDVPPLGCLAAAAAGLPSVAIANFTWDWIYQPLAPRSAVLARAAHVFSDAYRRTEIFFRLEPLSPPAAELPFPRTEDVPLLVRKFSCTRDEIRARLGLEHERRPVVLLSFGGFGLADLDVRALAEDRGLSFMLVGRGVPESERAPSDNVLRVDADRFHHPDLVRAADCVVSKPGYGTVAEVLAAQRPFLSIRREDFRETSVLLRALRAHGAVEEIEVEEARSGRFGDRVRSLLARPTESRAVLETDGARVIAERILSRLRLG